MKTKDKVIGGVILLTLLSLYVWALWITHNYSLWVIVLAVVVALLASVVITKLVITAVNLLTK